MRRANPQHRRPVPDPIRNVGCPHHEIPCQPDRVADGSGKHRTALVDRIAGRRPRHKVGPITIDEGQVAGEDRFLPAGGWHDLGRRIDLHSEATKYVAGYGFPQLGETGGGGVLRDHGHRIPGSLDNEVRGRFAGITDREVHDLAACRTHLAGQFLEATDRILTQLGQGRVDPHSALTVAGLFPSPLNLSSTPTRDRMVNSQSETSVATPARSRVSYRLIYVGLALVAIAAVALAIAFGGGGDPVELPEVVEALGSRAG